MGRVILHCDANSFYASVECLYTPSIRNKPVAVSGNPEERHGIILTKNAIAKGYGTHMFMSPGGLAGVNGFNNGERGLDCEKYIAGTEYYDGNFCEYNSNENMKFVCAVVIGTLDETVETGLTHHEYPDNWMFWEAK